MVEDEDVRNCSREEALSSGDTGQRNMVMGAGALQQDLHCLWCMVIDPVLLLTTSGRHREHGDRSILSHSATR